jgi:mono/diheme cytochrome c family protein
MRNRPIAICIALLVLPTAWPERHAVFGADPNVAKTTAPGQTLSFQDDIRPLFQAKCVRCHGGKATRGDLDLSTPAGALKGGESGKVIVLGKPDESLLYTKVQSGKMPPALKDPLSAAELDLIRRWIAGGAKFGGAEVAATPVTQHDVIPIMLRHCTACHGLRRQEANLDLHTREAMLRGGKSGPAIVPGKPDASLVLKKIRAGQMPPRDRLVEACVKPIEPAETDVLARWIAAGAAATKVEPDAASTTPDPLVSDKDREFWAFQPPRAIAVPTVRHADRVRNPIDAFLLQKLEEKGLTLAPEADRATLLRRVSFDLTGLPPEPAEVETFLADRAPDAYEKVVDRLLASPRYGERWGRFWLDAAGYADSEGKREQDLPRPNAWRYRDYVVRSFNADKPFDRFLLEQIAGDELADYEHAPEITPEIYDNLVATGFLRMAPDPSWANITGYVPDRLDVMADEVDILGSAVMGLTLKCAHCHNHKFDPIPQRDYYRLIDIFKGAYDEYDWLKPDVHPGIGPVSQDVLGGRLLPYVTTAERQAWKAHNDKTQAEIDGLRPEKGVTDADPRIKALQAQRTPEPAIQALWDRGDPSPTYIYRRGDPLNPGALVGPGVPSVLTDGKTPFEVKPPWPGAKKTGRRLAFARWLIRPEHPLTARVAVNRIWQRHFGAGIVKSLGNFGKAGSSPTHPELLDWLAREFVRQGWSVKAMHRLMTTSAAYRQSSAATADQEKRDPENALYSRMPLVRLDAEQLYDTLLLVAGRLDETRFGPADPVDSRADGLVTPAATVRGWRRLLYVQQLRKQVLTHRENFDFPQQNPNCIERRASTVAPQALYLMNNAMIQGLAEQFARRVMRQPGADASKRIDWVYRIALSRPPSGEEKRLGLDALEQFTDRWTIQAGADKPDKDAIAVKAMTTYCHTILNSAGFLFVD